MGGDQLGYNGCEKGVVGVSYRKGRLSVLHLLKINTSVSG